MLLLDFRRIWTALALRKSIESALRKSIESVIQWFKIHQRITFATMHNLAIYLPGAWVSIFPTSDPRLLSDIGTELQAPVLITRPFKIEPRHEISNNVVCATSKVSGQPAHMLVA